MQLAMRYAYVPLAGALITSCAGAATPSHPRSFLAALIAYEISGHADLRSRTFLSMLTPRLRSAVRVDMAGPDVGLLDYDPICQCQDEDGLRMRVISLRISGATATAELENSNGSTAWPVRLRLARTLGGWRVADVIRSEQPSLLAELERAGDGGR